MSYAIDPVVEEVRRVRQEFFKSFGFDPHKFGKFLAQRQARDKLSGTSEKKHVKGRDYARYGSLKESMNIPRFEENVAGYRPWKKGLYKEKILFKGRTVRTKIRKKRQSKA
jgi:hypothetical protein